MPQQPVDALALARVDAAVRASDQQALEMAHLLAEEEGLFVGSSSAMNCVGALWTALAKGPGHTVVTVLCDSGQRHLSRFWNPAFADERGLAWPSPPPVGAAVR